MNSFLRRICVSVALLAGFSFTPGSHAQTRPAARHAKPALPAGAMNGVAAQDKKTSAGEAFFIVASVDQSKSQVLLKRPTEVTLLVTVDAKTQFLDDAGKPLKIGDFRAGDTVWVTSKQTGDSVVALNIRKGQMTVADLHRYYLDFSEIK
jgi:hypothetical protein